MPASLWKSRDFVWLMTGRTISQFGTAMTTFVIPWLLLQRTGSAAQTGIAFAVGFVPYIFIALPAGVWADCFNRKTLMVIADFGRLCLLISIPLTHVTLGQTPLYLLYVVQAGVSGFSAVFDAAYGACLPNIVESGRLPEANNTLQTSLSMSKVIGPILGGLAVAWFGPANTILVDVLSYGVSIVSIVGIGKSFSAIQRSGRQTFSQEIREGFLTLWNINAIRHLMLFATLVNLVGPGMDVALLYRVQHELHLQSQWAGFIMTGLSGGMLLGSLVNRWVGKRIDIGTWLTISTILQVLPPIVLACARNPMVLCLVQIFIGVLLVAWNVQSVTLRQMLIPDPLRGRCGSVFRLSAWISIPLGDGLAGIVSQGYGTRAFFVIAASVLLTVSVLWVRLKLHREFSPTGTTAVIGGSAYKPYPSKRATES